MPLQGETPLKYHLHCLGPHAAILSYLQEWVATAAFGLGVVGGILRKWEERNEKIKCLLTKLTITAGILVRYRISYTSEPEKAPPT